MRKVAQAVAAYHLGHADRIARSNLLAGQSPQAVFFACSDSRMVPGGIAAADPGDLFVVRNVGNLVPAVVPGAPSADASSTGAAIEYALEALGVANIVVMGHRDCGAMKAVAKQEATGLPLLDSWLRNADPTWRRFVAERDAGRVNSELPIHDALSMINVAVQLENLASYPSVASRLSDGRVTLHGWWFDLGSGRVTSYDRSNGDFGPFEEIHRELLSPVA